jgi:hypothetical protein
VKAQSSSQVHGNAKSTKKNKLKNQRKKIHQFNLFDMKAWSSLPKFTICQKHRKKSKKAASSKVHNDGGKKNIEKTKQAPKPTRETQEKHCASSSNELHNNATK